MIDSFPAHLLWSHVTHGAHDCPRVCGAGLGCVTIRLLGWRLHKLGKAEIKDLDPAVFGNEQILRFQVAMNNSLLMGGCQCMSYLHGVACGLADGDGAMPQLFSKCFAFQQLGDKIWRAFKSTKPVHRQYVWMIECCGCLRLLGKTAQPVRVPRNKGRQDFDCHIPLQKRVASAVYLAHAARTQEAENLISIDLYSRCE